MRSRGVARALAAAIGAAMLMAALAPVVGGAQAFHGTLRGTAQGAPVSGAIVLLMDSARTIHARDRSDDQGHFVLHSNAAGLFRVRIQRIGVRPFESALFALTGDTTAVIALSELPVVLPRVTSTALSACRDRSFAAEATWQTWEDVRTALVATSLTYAEQRNRFRVAQVRRIYTAAPASLHAIALLEDSLTASQPWTSFAPEVLAEHGYVRYADDRVTFISPDLDVLLSRTFENTHCFQPTLQHNRALIGLSFEPGQTLKNNTDIAGTFWLDSATHELRTLTFRHTGLPFVIDDSSGESIVRFAKFDAKNWLISSWIIRAPIPSLSVNSRFPMPAADQLRLFGDWVEGREFRRLPWHSGGVNEQRGDVLSVRRTGGAADSSAIWTAPTGSIRVSVATYGGQKGSTTPLAGAAIRLLGSRHQRISDESGVATFEGLTPGDYKLASSTLAYEQFLEDSVETLVHVDTGTTTSAKVLLKTANEMMIQHCGDTNYNILAGSVTRDGRPVQAARLLVYDSVDMHDKTIKSILGRVGPTNADGRFVSCLKRITPSTSIIVRATAGDDFVASAPVNFSRQVKLQVIDLILQRDTTKRSP
jgi:hypothetical protein